MADDETQPWWEAANPQYKKAVPGDARISGGGQMSSISKRLDEVEGRRAFREFIDAKRQLEGRAREELSFLAVHGYFPEALETGLPDPQDFTVGGIRTVVTVERAKEPSR
jgi:hypothetical protein